MANVKCEGVHRDKMFHVKNIFVVGGSIFSTASPLVYATKPVLTMR